LQEIGLILALDLCRKVVVSTRVKTFMGNFNEVLWVEFLSYIAMHILIVLPNLLYIVLGYLP
jgi:hypothetical protein